MGKRRKGATRQAATYFGARALLGALEPLPWTRRLHAAGRIGRLALAASPGLRHRVESNLAYVLPELDAAARRRIASATGDCFGRTTLELFFARDFLEAHPWNAPSGPGLPAVEEALEHGRGAVIVSGHFGGWEAIRAWLASRGRPGATVYRPIKNRRLDALYHASVEQTGAPVVRKNRYAVRTLVKQLSRSGFVTLLVDQFERRAPVLDFLGRPAPTTLIPAELALKFEVPLIPAFAIRTEDGERIDVVFDAPVAQSTAAEMMQAVNHSLARMVRAHPGQYYWLHRRWSKTLPQPHD